MTDTQRPPRLIVVDDDADIRALVTATLAYAGYYPTTVATGEQAIAEAFALVPDLVISDVAMPGVSGLDVCRAVKSEPRTAGTAVLLLSAAASPTDIEAGRSAGADDYLAKPVRPSELLHRVRLLLGEVA
jgi:DNA-binding response OmpR family regulator